MKKQGSIKMGGLLLAFAATTVSADEITMRKTVPDWSALTSPVAGEGCMIEPQSQVIAEAKPGMPSGSWRAMSIGTRTSIEDRAPTLKFLSEGRVSGSTGCNMYSGRAVGFGSSLRFGSLSATMMACLEDGAMNQEQAFFTALENVSGLEIQEEQILILLDRSGEELLRFGR